MDEFDVVLRARRFLERLPLAQLPVPMSAYLATASDELGGAPLILRSDGTLASGEAGHTLTVGSKLYIVVNENDRTERQRFTVGHELAHLLLGIPTEHGDPAPEDGFTRRSPNEIRCDVFAAEILLPFQSIKSRVEDMDIGFAAVETLAEDFQMSLTATGSRFASVCDRPCAFVLTHGGIIRYVSRSTPLRGVGGAIRPGRKIADSSFAAHLRRGSQVEGPVEIPTAEWLDDWHHGGVLLEDARHLPRWDQTVSLLWFEDHHVPVSDADDDEEEPALRQLDGILPWPGRSKRRP